MSAARGRVTVKILEAIEAYPAANNCAIAEISGTDVSYVRRIRSRYGKPVPACKSTGRPATPTSAALRREMETDPRRQNGVIAAICGVSANRVANFRNRFGYPHARAS